MYVATLPCETRMTEKPTKFTVFQKTNESQHSAVKYLDKCFSSLQMSVMQYDYEPRFIEARSKCPPLAFTQTRSSSAEKTIFTTTS